MKNNKISIKKINIYSDDGNHYTLVPFDEVIEQEPILQALFQNKIEYDITNNDLYKYIDNNRDKNTIEAFLDYIIKIISDIHLEYTYKDCFKVVMNDILIKSGMFKYLVKFIKEDINIMPILNNELIHKGISALDGDSNEMIYITALNRLVTVFTTKSDSKLKEKINMDLKVDSIGGTTSDQRFLIKKFVSKLFEEYKIKQGKVKISIYDYKKIDDEVFEEIVVTSNDTFKEFIRNSNYTMDILQSRINNNLTFANYQQKNCYEILAMYVIFKPEDIKITRDKSYLIIPMLNLPQHPRQAYFKIDFFILQKLLNFESIEYLQNIIPVKEDLEEDCIIDLYL